MNEDILPLLLSGKYLPAVGLLLIAFVGAARVGLGSFWPWFTTKAGGYVLGYGSATLLFVGAALRDGSGLTFSLLAGALSMGWTSAGGWEAARDMVDALRGKGGDSALPKATAIAGVSVAALVVTAALLGGCGSNPPDISSSIPGSAVIDCTKTNAGELESAAKEIVPSLLAGGEMKWDAAADKAKSFAVNVGGCVLFELAQQYLGGRTAVDVAQSHRARDVLENYRDTVAGGATFRTAAGDL